ncbi:MAG: uroporphyrinogen decarboxylase family protein [Anaerolineae bacterium]
MSKKMVDIVRAHGQPPVSRSLSAIRGPYIKEIVATLDTVPILHICGRTNHLIEAMIETGVQGLSLGPMVDFAETIKEIPEEAVLLGNLDPVRVLNGRTPSGVYRATPELMETMAPHDNFILSTGCDLPMDTPLENIHAMMDAARGRSLAAHGAPRHQEPAEPRSA